jgi:hypothetical protein
LISLVAALVLGQATLAPAAGDSLKPFQIETAQGQPFSWQPGRVTVLCFCAMWCDTWKEQLPRLSKSIESLKGLPVDALEISVDGRWMDRVNGTRFDHLLSDPRGALSSSLGLDRVPYTLVVDAKGVVRWSEHGILRSDEMAQQVRMAMHPSSGGTIYLTFDDFPARNLNDQLLDVLRSNHVPSTFFCIGQNAQSNQEMVKRAAEEGHSIQIHSWDHQREDPQLNKCLPLLKAITGAPSTLYRAPGSEKIARLSGGYLHVYPDDPYDYLRPGVKELTRRVLNGARDGAVIQLHAGVQDTVDALPEIIGKLRRRGFVFARLD